MSSSIAFLDSVAYCFNKSYTVNMRSKFFKYKAKKSKYGNKKTEYNGILFDSKKEAEYCATLDILKKASKKEDRVTSYERQVPFQITLNKKKICKYFADFKVLYADGREEIVDVKGVKTDVYKIKKKLVEAQFGVKIVEV